jgi:hypothetical protein
MTLRRISSFSEYIFFKRFEEEVYSTSLETHLWTALGETGMGIEVCPRPK